VVLGFLTFALGTRLFVKGSVFQGNYLTQWGSTGAGVLIGGRPDLFPEPVWHALEVIAIAAGVALALVASSIGGAVFRTAIRGTAEGLVAAFALISGTLLIAYGLLVRADLFDRYLWPFAFACSVMVVANSLCVPALAVTAASPHRARAASWLIGVVAAAATALLVLVTGALTVNADSYDWARWRAGELAVKAGVGPARVDAGFEWVGDHTGEDAISNRHVAAAPLYETGYDQMYPGFRDCAFVSGSPWSGPDLRLLRTTTYNEVGVAVQEHLYVYLVKAPGCG
jgi:hypothetical protein